MSFFRSYIAPFLIVLIFAVAMLAVSARIFLPNDMMAPAPIEEMDIPTQQSEVSATPVTQLLSSLPTLLHGKPNTAV